MNDNRWISLNWFFFILYFTQHRVVPWNASCHHIMLQTKTEIFCEVNWGVSQSEDRSCCAVWWNGRRHFCISCQKAAESFNIIWALLQNLTSPLTLLIRRSVTMMFQAVLTTRLQRLHVPGVDILWHNVFRQDAFTCNSVKINKSSAKIFLF